ncbi:MAG: transaldolase family protein [Candidatus Woesearchaeota archaeon]
MKIFLDSAKLDEIAYCYSARIVDGVTTNPSLLKKAVDELKAKGKRVELLSYIKEILRVAKGTPVSLEVSSFAYEKMVEEGKRLYRIFNPVARNVYIKIPVNPSFSDEPSTDGLKAIRTLTAAGIPVNCTLIHTPEQALLAAKAGAKIVSLFAGRVDDRIRELNNIQFQKGDYFPAYGWRKDNTILEDNGIISGIELVRQTVEIKKKYGFNAQVLAASMRNPRQVREAALVGADIATCPFDVIKGCLQHPKTEEGMRRFTADVVPEYAVLGLKRKVRKQ